MTERLYRTMLMVQLEGSPHASALGSNTALPLDAALGEAKRLVQSTLEGDMPHKEKIIEITFVVLLDEVWRERFTEIGQIVLDIPIGMKPNGTKPH